MKTTKDLAALANVRPQSIRVALYRSGAWRGLKPQKLSDGHLIWHLSPEDADRIRAARRQPKAEG